MYISIHTHTHTPLPTQAVLQYLFITLAGLHGGHYLVGFWLSLGTAGTAGVLVLGQYLMNRSYYAETDGTAGGSAGAGSGLFLPSHLKQTDRGRGGGYGSLSSASHS